MDTNAEAVVLITFFCISGDKHMLVSVGGVDVCVHMHICWYVNLVTQIKKAEEDIWCLLLSYSALFL